MGLIIVAVIAAGLAGVLGAAARKPAVFTVSRSMDVAAPPQVIFPLIDDFRHWVTWSPWEKLDPGMKKSHTGSERGPGAVYAWEGNGKVGAGRMEITRTVPPSSVSIKLDFLRPFKASNTTEFTLDPVGDGTRVTWAMQGPSPFMNKVMSVFVNMDRLIGKDFEAGLANLKAEAEGRSASSGGSTV